MSGFGARIDLRNAEPVPVAARRMASWLERRARDGKGQWVEGHVALVHAAFHTAPEDVNTVQPLASEDGQVRVIAFARIDNRPELLAALGSAALQRGSSAAHLILAAYLRWGAECVRHLIGDFAFAIWDQRSQTLLCARDPLGVRTLYYAADGDGIVAGTEVGVVLAALDRRPPHNRAMIEDQLANRWERYQHETAFEDVFRLPPGYRLQFTRGKLQLDRYWVPQAVRGRDSEVEEYLREFRARFTRAVRDRLQANGPVGISVSGGMDSSSIACVTEALVGEAPPGTYPDVRLYSSVFQDTRFADERLYFDAVAAKCAHLQARPLLSDECWSLREFGTDHGFPLDEPEVGRNRALPLRVARAAHDDGCRVVLSGVGADQLLCGEAYYSPYLMRDVPLARIAEELPHFQHRSRRPSWWILATAYGLPLLPKSWQTGLGRLLRKSEAAPMGLPLRQPSPEPLRGVGMLASPALPTCASSEIYRHLSSPLFLGDLGDVTIAGLEAGIEWRYAFVDRPLLELMLSMPSAALFYRGMMKRPIRQGLAELLPDEVRTRSTFAHFSELSQRGLRERECSRLEELLRQPRIVSEGYLDADRLSTAWNKWREAPERYCTRPLFVSLAIEAWLRSQEEEQSDPLVNRDPN